VFPILSKLSNFDQIIEKRLPVLLSQISVDETDLHQMVSALQQKRHVFEQAFIHVKQLQEQEVSDLPNPKTVAFSERVDLIYVRDVDKVVEYLTA